MSVVELEDIANKLRIDVLQAVSHPKTGHPTSCSSIAEIMAVLFFKVMHFSVSHPRDPANDRLVLSKGHCAPILYAVWVELGVLPKEKLLKLRTLYSDLEGHPTPKLEFVDVATGSLGVGLSMAVGMAYVGHVIDKAPFRVYCIVGDGECTEGAIWEAVNFAGAYKLANLCVIVDVNRFSQCGPTVLGHQVEIYKQRFESFDFNAVIVDGHSIEELEHALEEITKVKDKPSVLVAKTIKGKNYPSVEDADGFHGNVADINIDQCIQHLESLLTKKDAVSLKPHPALKTRRLSDGETYHIQLSTLPDYRNGTKTSTTTACANALVKMAQADPRVLVFDTDVCTSTHTVKVKDYDTSRLIQCFSSEQNALGLAIGAAARDKIIPFVCTLGAFLTKAHDFIRMGAISQANINICGTHCGIAEGDDGPSHMAMEDIAMFRSIPGCTIFYPSDAFSTERAVELAGNTNGICYVRLSSHRIPIIYDSKKKFRIGEAHILRKHASDSLLLISAGVTLAEALSAGTQLAEDGIHVRIMDLFTVKPIDKTEIIKNAHEVGGSILTIEDHYPEGGIGEAVMSVVAFEKEICVKKVAVPKIPRSGKASELLDYFGISAANIVMTVKEMCQN